MFKITLPNGRVVYTKLIIRHRKSYPLNIEIVK